MGYEAELRYVFSASQRVRVRGARAAGIFVDFCLDSNATICYDARMDEVFQVQGRMLRRCDVEAIRDLIARHPEWTRWRLSVELAQRWDWRTTTGQLKDMAARSLLLKLDARGLIELPPRRPWGGRVVGRAVELPTRPELIEGELKSLRPVQVELVQPGTDDARRFSAYLACYHYLGYRGPVGRNVGYWVRDARGRELGCVLFGAAAWRVRVRDEFIGWTDAQRRARLQRLANNSRFLILPWVRVPHLGSHVLGRVMRRVRRDWYAKYGEPLDLVETFVERGRFAGTVYRASNWTWVGVTQGRGRQGRQREYSVPVKDVYVYPLVSDFRERLCR